MSKMTFQGTMIVPLLLFVVGCGSRVLESRTSLAEAQAICAIDDAALDAVAILIRAYRDDGMPRIDLIVEVGQSCIRRCPLSGDNACEMVCWECVTAMVDAAY